MLKTYLLKFLRNSYELCEDKICSYDACIYGVTVIFHELQTYFCGLLIGIVFGIPLEITAFYILYSNLRICSGGFHAKTFLRCLSISSLIFIAVAILASGLHLSFISNILIVIITIVEIVNGKPITNENHKIPELKIKRCEKRFKRNYFLYFTLYFILLYCLPKYALVVFLAMIINSGLRGVYAISSVLSHLFD